LVLKGQRPNIIIIFSDDHALQAISAYGSPHIQTPHIDRLAKEGAIFKNAFCTNSICAPSRAVLLTGKYNHLNGQIDNRTTTVMDTWQPSFPKYLQQNGYTTAWIGKWHISNTPRYFDYWKVLPGQGNYYNPDFIRMDSSIIRMPGYATEIITDEALSWLDTSTKKAKPFCLVIGHKAPHREWQPDIKDLHAFDNRISTADKGIAKPFTKPFEVPSTFFDHYENRYAAAHQLMEVKDMRWDWDSKVNMKGLPIYERMDETQKKGWDEYYEAENKKIDTLQMSSEEKALWKYQRYMHDYLGCILSLDRNIGRVLEYLDKNDLTKNTLVIYSSDQGFYLGEHGWFDKRFMYEPSLHMPLLMRFPSIIKPGLVINKSVVNIDYAPTILDFAGIKIPGDMQGKSFKQLLKNPDLASWRNSTYYHYYEYPDHHRVLPHFGVRTERYKLIGFYDSTIHWELYDLKSDPSELHNKYDQPDQRTLIKTLKAELKKLMIQYRDEDALKVLGSK
jgi:arylsulfatase A-like enzyme